jgi:predicted methyltransferase MtxX (methanogen marker protein 4)
LLVNAAIARGAITYSVTFVDSGNAHSASYAAITAHIQAAGARWAGYLSGSGSLEVQVEFTTAIARIDGASFSNGFVHKNGARDVFEQGAAFEVRTGTDPNGASPDIRIRINPDYLANEVWLDPNPAKRSDPIPANHIDGMSLFIHELGHAFLFAGWMDGTTGALPATYMSTFDEQVQFDGTNFFFVGANAQARYGGPVPLTYGNPGHLGNLSPRPGADLVNDLMYGPFYSYQKRYDISAVDLAMAKDAGVALLPESRLVNIATRLKVQSGENVLIGGFIITGTGSKKVIIRGIGPSLAQFFSGTLSDPALELFQGNTSLASNNDWKESQAEIEATGIPPTNDKESAIVRTLAPGSYTAVLRGNAGSTGIGVVEVYDLDQSSTSSKLANIASRGFVDTDNNVMIGGLIAGPTGGALAKVVVRAIGPSLGNFGIAGALQDPTLDLVDSNGVTLRSNNNWKDSQQTEIEGAGLQPSDSRESALIETLAPGNYTAIVRGAGNTTGVGLVEVYNLP